MNKKSSLSFAVVIPARYKSSRFPGKPLVDLLGKPMIQHVWELSVEAVGAEQVYVATDDARIQEVCLSFGAQVVMTSGDCLTGTDRLAEVNEALCKDFLINVQGDEPLLNPLDISLMVDAYRANPGSVINAMCKIGKDEWQSLTVPKVVASKSGRLLYMSRSPIPSTKGGGYIRAMKQVCIYAFGAEHLKFFASTKLKTPIEDIEDIEILRFLENDVEVKMIEVDAGSAAIDVEGDVGTVLQLLQSRA